MSDEPITLPPIGGGRAREQDYWTPKNYDGGGGGVLTLRRALENSRNLATVHLLDGGIENTPEASLDRICELALEAQIYRECVRYYPFVLGAQPVRPIDLAAFYAAIANEGVRPAPYVIEFDRAQRPDRLSPRSESAVTIGSVDRAAFYQLKTMLQGVLARGTARSIAGLAPYVAGKTGTSDDENDAWFVGFTNDVTVAVWVGYDNADGKRRTLGGGADRRRRRGADLRADHAGGVGECCAESRACAAVARRPSASWPASRSISSPANAESGGKADHRMLPDRSQRPGPRHPVPTGLARGRLCARESRGYYGVAKSLVSRSRPEPGYYGPAPGTITTTTTAAMFRHRAIRGGRPGSISGKDLTVAIRAISRRRRRAIRMVASTKRRSASIPAISGATGDTTERQHDAEPEAGRLARGPGGLCRDVDLSQPKLERRQGQCAGVHDREVTSRRRARVDQLKPKTIAFVDRPSEELIDPDAGLIRFEDWAQAKPVEKQFLSPFPSYLEPHRRGHGRRRAQALQGKASHVCGRGALCARAPPGSIDLASLCHLPFVERIDSAIKHRLITSAEAVSPKDPRAVNNQHPLRRWCETRSATICIRSRYQFEGKLPVGIQIANKLREGSKKIADYLEFESELTLRPPAEVTEMGLATLTGLDTPPVGALEQNIFYVNQVMQFGKLLAVFQPHPTDPNQTVVTVFMALAVETSIIGKKKEYMKVPVLRNLVPAQVLAGKSSFNTGKLDQRRAAGLRAQSGQGDRRRSSSASRAGAPSLIARLVPLVTTAEPLTFVRLAIRSQPKTSIFRPFAP